MSETPVKPQPAMAGACPYHWNTIPITKGMTSRTNGTSFQNGGGANGIICKQYSAAALQAAVEADAKCDGGEKQNYPLYLKKDKADEKKIKQVVSGKELLDSNGEKKFPQVFVENKGLEEICRRVFTGILDS